MYNFLEALNLLKTRKETEQYFTGQNAAKAYHINMSRAF